MCIQNNIFPPGNFLILTLGYRDQTESETRTLAGSLNQVNKIQSAEKPKSQDMKAQVSEEQETTEGEDFHHAYNLPLMKQFTRTKLCSHLIKCGETKVIEGA